MSDAGASRYVGTRASRRPQSRTRCFKHRLDLSSRDGRLEVAMHNCGPERYQPAQFLCFPKAQTPKVLQKLDRLTHGARTRRRKVSAQGSCDGFDGRPAKYQRGARMILGQQGLSFHELDLNLLRCRCRNRLVLYLVTVHHAEFPDLLPFEAFADCPEVILGVRVATQ